MPSSRRKRPVTRKTDALAPKRQRVAAGGLRLDLTRFVPYLLNAIISKFIAASSRIYFKRHGCGMVEWRILSMLALNPTVPASHLSALSGINKSVISRTLKLLVERGYVNLRPDAADRRKELLSLTHEGLALHNEMIVTVLEHERLLFKGFSESDQLAMVTQLRQMLDNVRLIK
jgi:DNA-binding MarR family transcriptional regulator